jgi:hypothetical protein
MKKEPTIKNDKKTKVEEYLDPKTKKFKKGNPGGPGRPEGAYSLVAILKRKLAEAVKKGGKEAGEELVELWVEKAKKEKAFDALKEIVRYVDGMPKQTTDITSGGKPIPIIDLTKKS